MVNHYKQSHQISNNSGLLAITVWEVLVYAVNQKEKWRSKHWETWDKAASFMDDMMGYLGNWLEYPDQLLVLIREFSSAVGYKDNIQKYISYLPVIAS